MVRRTIAFLVLVAMLCGCTAPKLPFMGEESKSTPSEVQVQNEEFKLEVSKLFDNELKSALKKVFGDAKLVDAVEEEHSIYLAYTLPREVKSGDLEAFINVTGYNVDDIIVEGSEAMLSKKINGKEYSIHVIFVDKTAEFEIEFI
jgi:hypothetical protein